jgi:hypothetical protein
MKGRRNLLFVVLFLSLIVVALQVLPASTFASAAQAYSPSESSLDSIGPNRRLTEINRALGIPMAELEKMTAKEVSELTIENAEKLGVIVYENAWDYLGNEIPKIIAGNRVNRPESFDYDQ